MHPVPQVFLPWLERTSANQRLNHREMVSWFPAVMGGKQDGPSVQGALLVVTFVVIGKIYKNHNHDSK